ncbi:FMRFamide related propeptide [Oratosquilla oratoria]|uniref:FMRFamide related propeptide n=1 Tax=Oratosquilla oratoria TaxID=337810 RepID=UPI003F777260
MFLAAWLFWTTLTCWSLSEVSSLPPGTIDLSPPNAEEGELLELPSQKRFISYMLRPPTLWTSAENVNLEGHKRGYEKNFLRFGRNNGGVELDEDISPIEEPEQNAIDKKSPAFLRFGREAQKKNRNFLRFGRNDGHFVHFANDGQLENFANDGELPAGDLLDLELEAAKRSRNFLRFGRASDKNFLRFGRDRNFLRFGRSVSGHDDNDHDEKSLNFGESASIAPSSSPSSPASQILDSSSPSSSSSAAASKKRSPRAKRFASNPIIVSSYPDDGYVVEDASPFEKRADRLVLAGQGSHDINQRDGNGQMIRLRNFRNIIRYG